MNQPPAVGGEAGVYHGFSQGPPAWRGDEPLGPVRLDITRTEPDGLGRYATGQVFGPGRGVFYAIDHARRIADQPTTISVTVTEYRRPDKRILFRYGIAGEPDLDLTPWCPLCATRRCRDISEHYTAIRPHLAAWADTHDDGGAQ